MRGVDSSEIPGREDLNSQNANEASHLIWLRPVLQIQVCLRLLNDSVALRDLLQQVVLPLHEHLLSVEVVLDELIQVDLVVAIDVAVVEHDIDDLVSMLFIDTLLHQENVHFIFILIFTPIFI